MLHKTDVVHNLIICDNEKFINNQIVKSRKRQKSTLRQRKATCYVLTTQNCWNTKTTVFLVQYFSTLTCDGHDDIQWIKSPAARSNLLCKKYSVVMRDVKMKPQNIVLQVADTRNFKCFVITVTKDVIAEFLRKVPWQNTY